MIYKKRIAIQHKLDQMINDASKTSAQSGHQLVQTYTSAAESIPILIDTSRSKGARLFDLTTGQMFLDLHGGFGSDPFGRNSDIFQNHLATQLLTRTAQNKTAHSDFSTTEYVTSISLIWNHYVTGLGETFQNGHLHLIDGGSMAINQAITAAIITKLNQNNNQKLFAATPFLTRAQQSGSPNQVLAIGEFPLGQMVISFGASFHGRDGYTASLSKGSYKLDGLPKFPFVHLDAPTSADPTDISTCLIQLETETKRLGNDLAAVVIEDAIQCEGGDIHIPREFYKGIRKLADEFGFYVIYDGVQTGFYSSGDPAAFLTIDAPPPDIYVTGKKTSVGCVIANSKMASLPNNAFKLPGRLDSTFGGDSTCVARFAIAATALAIPEFRSSMTQRYNALETGLHDLKRDFPELIRDVRAMGALLTIETTDALSASELIKVGLDHHIILLHSRNPHIIRLRPNLDIQPDEINESLKKLKACLKSVSETLFH